MPVKQVPTLGWTRGDVAATIRLVTTQQREEIARRVREGMEREGLTNAALAYRAGLAEKTISRLINARLEPRYDTLDRVARALGITEGELRGPPPPPLGLGRQAAVVDQPALAEIMSAISRLEDQIRLLRADLQIRDAEEAQRNAEDGPASQLARRRQQR